MRLKNTNHILLITLVIYLIATVFKLNRWPFTLELSVLSATLAAFLLFRHHRMYFKSEKSKFLRRFMTYNSAAISCIVFFSVVSFTQHFAINYDTILNISWALLIFQTLIYYLYYLIHTKQAARRSYLTLFFIGIVFFAQTLIIFFTSNLHFDSPALYILIALTLLAFLLFLPVKKHIVGIHYQPSLILLIAGIFMLSIMIISKSQLFQFYVASN